MTHQSDSPMSCLLYAFLFIVTQYSFKKVSPSALSSCSYCVLTLPYTSQSCCGGVHLNGETSPLSATSSPSVCSCRVAIYFCLPVSCHLLLFSFVDLLWKGGGAGCPLIGRLGKLGKILNPVCEWVWISSGTLCVSPCSQCMYGGVNGVNVRCSVKHFERSEVQSFYHSCFPYISLRNIHILIILGNMFICLLQ